MEKKKKNNGLLIALSKNNRELCISTGIGTRKIITDSICQNIVDFTIIPEFKNKNYYQGINNALETIIYKWK